MSPLCHLYFRIKLSCSWMVPGVPDASLLLKNLSLIYKCAFILRLHRAISWLCRVEKAPLPQKQGNAALCQDPAVPVSSCTRSPHKSVCGCLAAPSMTMPLASLLAGNSLSRMSLEITSGL